MNENPHAHRSIFYSNCSSKEGGSEAGADATLWRPKLRRDNAKMIAPTTVHSPLWLVTPSNESEGQQMSKHMWEEHTKQKKTRDCPAVTHYLALTTTTQFRVQAHDVEEVRRPFR